MSKKSWIIFVVVIVGLVVGLVVWSKNTSPSADVSSINPDVLQVASEANGNIGDHTFGKLDSSAVLIEYGDFQCPPCASVEPTVEGLLDKYSDKLLFIFRNFPIASSHPNAKAAAATAEAAGLQGKYWEMHNKIYASQSEWSSASANERTAIFARYASELSLNMSKFNSDIANPDVSKKINLDLSIGKKDGVEATPTFMLNGEKVSVDQLESSVQAKLEI